MDPWERFKARFGKTPLGTFQLLVALQETKAEALAAYEACEIEYTRAHLAAAEADKLDTLTHAMKHLKVAKAANELLLTIKDEDHESVIVTSEALLDACADVTLALRVAKRTEDELTLLGGTDCPLNSRRQLELEQLFSQMCEVSPEVDAFLKEWLPNVKIDWSDTVKDARYDSVDGVITLSSKGDVSPQDILDALLFEVCNVENQETFQALDKEYRKTARKAPMSSKDYGRQKSDIEAMSVAKNVELLVSVMVGGGEVSYQGQRNMLALLKTAREQDDGTVANYQATLDDPVLLLAAVKANLKELSAFLEALKDTDDTDARDAYLEVVATSTHNDKATDPWDTTGLSTEDLYVAGLLEQTKAYNIGPMIIADIKKAGKLGKVNVQFIQDFVNEAFLKTHVRTRAGKGPASIRLGLIMRAVEDLFTIYPILTPEDLPSVAFSDRLKAVGKATIRHGLDDAHETEDGGDPDEALEARRVDYDRTMRARVLETKNDLRRALSAATPWIGGLAEQLALDARVSLAALAEVTSVPGVNAAIASINGAKTTEDVPKVTVGADAIQAALERAAYAGFFAATGKLDVDSGPSSAVATRAEAVMAEVRKFPVAVVAECGLALRVMGLAIRDLKALDG